MMTLDYPSFPRNRAKIKQPEHIDEGMLMFFNLKRKINMAWFNQNAKTILDTPPVKLDWQSPVALVTELCHRDILMYLLAVKSLARFIPNRKVFILDDT